VTESGEAFVSPTIAVQNCSGFPGSAYVSVVEYAIAEIGADGIGMLTFWIVYPAPRGLISHF
jgi:hypothetical protein